MQLSSEYVGRCCRPIEIEVSARRIMNYAAAVPDPNPWYLDDLRPEGIVAPPMLAVALTWPLSEHFAEYWADGSPFPVEVLTRQVHYSEVLEWYRPILPGDHLTIDGRVIAIVPHRAGTQLILRYEARDTAGKPVFAEYIGGLLRGVRCADRGRGAEDLPEDPTLKPNDTPLWETRLEIDPLAPLHYDGGADIHFPIHSSPAFAKAVGLPGILYQGTATLSLAVCEIINKEANGDPRSLKRLSCIFSGMVLPGTEIAVRLEGKETQAGTTHFAFSVWNGSGQQALRNGCLSLVS